eukprot:15441001-Alexandrium_andersonii.AAC.1
MGTEDMDRKAAHIAASPPWLGPRPDGLGGPRHRSAVLAEASNSAQDFRAHRGGSPVLGHDSHLRGRSGTDKAG